MAKKNDKKKVVKKGNTEDNNVFTLILGSLLVTISDYTDGNLLERTLVIFGFFLMIAGIVPMMIKSKREHRKWTFILSVVCALLIIAFAIVLVINNM